LTGDGVVIKGQAYGFWSIPIDVNDALARHSAVHIARDMAIKQHRPILIEVTQKVNVCFI